MYSTTSKHMNLSKVRDALIQECTPVDYDAVAAIYNEYIFEGNSTMEESECHANEIAQWVDQFNAREKLLVMKKRNAVVAWGIIKRYSDRSGYRLTAETAVYVTASERRKGYGSKMKEVLIEQCRDLGYHHLVAKVFARNLASIQYNLKLGYSIVGTQKEIGFKNNEWLDVVIMQYLIEPNSNSIK
jgi:L-amino acid N-acyltransferase YncA